MSVTETKEVIIIAIHSGMSKTDWSRQLAGGGITSLQIFIWGIFYNSLQENNLSNSREELPGASVLTRGARFGR